jgi:hypothetical protein
LALMRIVITPGQHIGGLRTEGTRRAKNQKTRQQELDQAFGRN